MEHINMTLSEKIEKELEKELQKSLKDEDFCNLVKRNKLPRDITLKNNTKLMDTCDELKNCKTCKGLFMCKNKVSGHVLYPSFSDETLKFIYMPCKYQKELLKKESEKKEKLNEIKNARMKDIDIEDKNRYKVIKWLKKYFDDAITEVVYLPETLRNMKEDFSLVEDKVNYLKNVDILLIDDIGAENVTAWGRDEILGTILQYRMNNKLSTFFTSNLTLEELEVHLSLSKNSEDKVKARRIIERIKYLTEEQTLISGNKRK